MKKLLCGISVNNATTYLRMFYNFEYELVED